ncbi:MarR family transcriptional regulator [Paraglaciecola chathamensis]|uniref:HVO_A0114 family putative DNA-binding protein n=1 Tax=Paraglaciecola chathamensis TaxID=368405 RepID=UPI0026F994D0|nr:MarR family transcriptional regulator [Paraglaciecola chathamensis]MDO6842152.1 MarR family transcriptional regulator [Paraglaciecola chathamensis]
MRTKVLRIGIISKQEYINRTIAIAKGEYKPKKDEPKVWFESIKSMAQVLSNENQELLKLIAKYKPCSITELERISHRKKANLSRTLKTLEKYNIVDLPKTSKGTITPKVRATDFKVQFGLHYSHVGEKELQSAF